MSEPLFNKVAGLRPPALLKNRLWQRCFPVNFAKFLRTPFYRPTLDDCFYNSILLNRKSVKDKYCPVSILPSLYKRFSSFLITSYQKNSVDLEKIIALSITLEKWKGNVDQGKVSGSLLTDLLLPRCKPSLWVRSKSIKINKILSFKKNVKN